jgi:galacturonokinase
VQRTSWTDRVDTVRREAVRRYGLREDRVCCVYAPYRVCPLGAHIDHQLGPVTALAIDEGVLFAYAATASGQVRLSSVDFPGAVEFDLGHVPARRDGDWGNYARGAVRALQARARLRHGLVGVTSGPISGGGLSSSAAIGVAFLLALEEANGLRVSPAENVRLDQAIENEYLGLHNGILDQSAILFSRRGHLTRVDCATVGHELFPRPATMPPFRILIAFSGIRRALVGTDYNRRVAECARAATALLRAAGRPGAAAKLGSLTDEDYAGHRHVLSGPEAKRAAHFFAERARVTRGVEAWAAGDVQEFGLLMTASGQSSIDNYECGSPPLIDLYHLLVRTPGVYGARFSGAGFRGCCVALVEAEAAAEAAGRVQRAYAVAHPELAADATTLLCDSDDGARHL